MLGDLVGERVEPVYDGPVSTDPPRVGSIERARTLIGYDPGVSLRDGLADVLAVLRDSLTTT